MIKFPSFESIYQTALDFAKQKNHQEIVALLLRGPIPTPAKVDKNVKKSKMPVAPSRNPASKVDNADLNELKSTISKLQTENAQLKAFLFSLKDKESKLESVDFKNYEESSIIGKGNKSTVSKIWINKREEYAKKELGQFDHKSLQRFLNESEVLVQLHHPCIVRIFGFDYGDSSHPPSIFLSFEPSSLEKSIQNHELTNEDKNRITVEIVLGMRYIHSFNLMHRNLKPGNILLSKNKHVRISDFGLTKEEDLETLQSKGVGMMLFMAPELIDDDEENDESQERYNGKVDVYSFGITLLYIVTEQYPKYTMKQKLTGTMPKISSTVVPWVSELIVRCLQSSHQNRPGFNEIFEILKSHNFNLFNETSPAIQQRLAKENIERRILKIEAFEYQQRLELPHP